MSWEQIRDSMARLPHKQIKLFACDVLRLLIQRHGEIRWLEQTSEMAESFLFGKVDKKTLMERAEEVRNVTTSQYVCTSWALRSVLSNGFRWTARCAANTVVWSNLSTTELYNQSLPTQQFAVTPLLQAMAREIVQERKFEQYYILLDNLDESQNVILPRVKPIGLSHYVLYHLTNTR